jgi:hypothetical protein
MTQPPMPLPLSPHLAAIFLLFGCGEYGQSRVPISGQILLFRNCKLCEILNYPASIRGTAVRQIGNGHSHQQKEPIHAPDD